MGNMYLKETIKISKNAGKCFFGERQYDPAYIPRVLVPVTNVKTEEHLTVNTDHSSCITNLLVSGFFNIFSVTSCCKIIISLS